jgi:hypothetical protein
MNSSKGNKMERLGALCGIIGAFLAASGFGAYGYPLFTLSSVLLLATSIRQKQHNLIALQSAFLCANIVGIYHFVGI